MAEFAENTHDLIVTIVKKRFVEEIIEATKNTGAEGGTIIPGRGTGIHEGKKLLGIPIEPEKDILLTLVPKNMVDEVLSAIIKAGNLNCPGTGICFVLDVKKIAGIVHFLEQYDAGCFEGEQQKE